MNPRILTVLFADVVDSTRLYQTRGDAHAHRKVSQALQNMKCLIEKHEGKLLRTVGDSALASFAQADTAYQAAVDIQRAHASMDLSVRIGFHHGEVIPDAGDVYGHAVNLAARVASFAEADEICITEAAVARLSVLHRSNAHYLDKVAFKGMNEPMSVYRVSWNQDNEHTTIVGSVAHTNRYQTDRVLNLGIGSLQRQVCPERPLLSIGRADTSDLVVEAASASRHHARIEFIRGRYVLVDSSTNGTYVIKGNNNPEFVLRESVTLDENGSIGLGATPVAGAMHVITYQQSLP